MRITERKKSKLRGKERVGAARLFRAALANRGEYAEAVNMLFRAALANRGECAEWLQSSKTPVPNPNKRESESFERWFQKE